VKSTLLLSFRRLCDFPATAPLQQSDVPLSENSEGPEINEENAAPVRLRLPWFRQIAPPT
jgi:hypothetical protein